MTASGVMHLHAGELCFGKKNKTIETLLGSCVSVVLWHEVAQYGGICHFALPRSQETLSDKLDPRYAQDCFVLFEDLAKKRKLALSAFNAKLFGGGNSFARFNELSAVGLEDDDKQYIGDKNVAIAFELLTHYRIPLVEADVGEFGYRKLQFDMRTGDTASTFTAFGPAKT